MPELLLFAENNCKICIWTQHHTQIARHITFLQAHNLFLFKIDFSSPKCARHLSVNETKISTVPKILIHREEYECHSIMANTITAVVVSILGGMFATWQIVLIATFVNSSHWHSSANLWLGNIDLIFFHCLEFHWRELRSICLGCQIIKINYYFN